MAEITKKRKPGTRGEFHYRVEWWDNDGEIHEDYFDWHRQAVEFVCWNEGRLLKEAMAEFNEFMATWSRRTVNVSLGKGASAKQRGARRKRAQSH